MAEATAGLTFPSPKPVEFLLLATLRWKSRRLREMLTPEKLLAYHAGESTGIRLPAYVRSARLKVACSFAGRELKGFTFELNGSDVGHVMISYRGTMLPALQVVRLWNGIIIGAAAGTFAGMAAAFARRSGECSIIGERRPRTVLHGCDDRVAEPVLGVAVLGLVAGAYLDHFLKDTIFSRTSGRGAVNVTAKLQKPGIGVGVALQF